jgi:hypothetical protein
MGTYIKFFIHSAHFNVGTLCRTESIQSKLQFFPRASQHASIDCCDDIRNPCLQIFTSCNLQPTVIFQQDGAPPHWGRIVRDCLDATFPNRWPGRDGRLAWPPRSPDITPLDFFLWSYVKDKVYATKVTWVEDPKTRIRDVVTTINRGMLACTWEELGFRLDVFVRHRVPTLKCAECIKKLWVCIYQIKLVWHFPWKFIIFNFIVKLVRDFWPNLYNHRKVFMSLLHQSSFKLI